MTWIALALFGVALVLWRHSQFQKDEIVRFLQLSIALVCLMSGLVMAHWLLNLSILISLLIYPTCSPYKDRIFNSNCSQLCLRKNQCKSESIRPTLTPRKLS